MLVVGLSHKTAPIQVREKLAFDQQRRAELLRQLMALPGMRESVVLSTCNRVEIYASATDEQSTRGAILELLTQIGGAEVTAHLSSFASRDAVLHLFRVASSLDSLVVGEPQILGQLKEAMHFAEEIQTVGNEVGTVMRAALGVAKKVRSETAIGAGQVSISSVAVDLARQIFEDLSSRAAVLVGAGEMAEAAARLLAKSGVRLLVCNRSAARAEALVGEVGGTAHAWNDLDLCLVEADIVIASTSSATPVITRDRMRGLRRMRRGRSLFLIDIAVPRDVEPTVNELDNVYLYDIDDLSKVVASSLQERAQEAERAERLVAEEALRFEARSAERAVAPVIQQLRDKTRSVLGAELDKSLRSKLRHLVETDRQALEAMLDAAVNKLLHGPSTKLRALARGPQGEELAGIVKHLFELGEGRTSDPDIRISFSDIPPTVTPDSTRPSRSARTAHGGNGDGRRPAPPPESDTAGAVPGPTAGSPANGTHNPDDLATS